MSVEFFFEYFGYFGHGIGFVGDFKTVFLPGFVAAFKNPSTHAGFVLVGVRYDSTVWCTSKEISKSIEWFGRAQPYKAVFLERYFGAECRFVLCSDAAANSVGSQNDIGVLVLTNVVYILFEMQVNTFFATALVQ